MTTKRSVDKVVKRHYWNGFFDHLEYDDSLDPSNPFPDHPWRDWVATLSYDAGMREAKRVLSQRELKRTGMKSYGIEVNASQDIPARVFADAYAAAGIARVCPRKGRHVSDS